MPHLSCFISKFASKNGCLISLYFSLSPWATKASSASLWMVSHHMLSEFHCPSCSLKSSLLQKIEKGTTITGSHLYKKENFLFSNNNRICLKLNICLSNKNMYVLMILLLRQELCSVKEFTEDSNSSSKDRKITDHRDLIFSFLFCNVKGQLVYYGKGS